MADQDRQIPPPPGGPAPPPPGGPAPPPGPGAQNVNVGANDFAAALVQAIDRLRPLQMNEQPGGQPNQAGQLKPPKLESLDPESFLVWKRNFLDTAVLNNWDVNRAKLTARAALSGEAAAACHTIDLGDNQRTLENLLDDYENRILTPAASTMAESLFEQASQAPGESVNKFHARLRSLFVRAFPNLLPEVENRRELIKRFLAGLKDGQIRLHAKSQNPQTYTAACEAASQYEAVLLSEKPGGSRGHGVHQMQAAAATAAPPRVARIGQKENSVTGSVCRFCHRDTHETPNCFALYHTREALKTFPESTYRPQSRGSAPRGRGGRGRGRGNSRSSVNALYSDDPSLSTSADTWSEN